MTQKARLRQFFFMVPALVWAGCSSDNNNGNQPDGGGGDAAVGAGGHTATGGATASGGSTTTGGTTNKGGSSTTGGTTSKGGSAGTTATGGTAGEHMEAGAGGEATDSGTTTTDGGDAGTIASLDDVENIVVIYAENRSFDGLFGNFPGAQGLSDVVDSTGTPTSAYHKQLDRDGTTALPTLPPTWGGATQAGNPTQVPQAMTTGLANAPFSIESGFGTALTTFDVTRDLTHRFFENIMEINGGTNDMFGAWLDAGGLTMGHWDYSKSKLYDLAKKYVLADNFFEAAYGGSFLNHQYLICACAPTASDTFVANNKPVMNTLSGNNSKGVPQLATAAGSPASALSGAPSFMTGTIAPQNYFGTNDGYRAVNTMQPAYQPSGNQPVAGATGDDLAYADASKNNTLEPQTQTTIGDLLTGKNIDWAWYAGSWDNAVADGKQAPGTARTVIYTPSTPRGSPDFQAHHHPFNYYTAFDPKTHADARAQHLKDETKLVSDAANGTLPPVAFYKPQGNFNQHPMYANLDDGDAHIADLVSKLQAGPQWKHMVIVITYDEYGGQWDHVAPPKGDLLGPGTRIPAIIVSPFAKAGKVDHTQYDTGSVLRLVTSRFGLTKLAGLVARDKALTDNGGMAMGDLTAALNIK
jgi:acid phosphatase